MSVHNRVDAVSAADGSTVPARAAQGQCEAEALGVGVTLNSGAGLFAATDGAPVGAGEAAVGVAARGTCTGLGQAVRLAGAPASTGTAVGRMPQPAAAPASRTSAAALRTALTVRPPGWVGCAAGSG
ncbi:hypothetical protein AB0442_14640 [Kitasatospora sp. NPDC085895]|uniref:hypothetical protein n=1 Tax=Kitasatospora sp. NPDC085895 TaxID=3155057 RepID=UPI00344D4479